MKQDIINISYASDLQILEIEETLKKNNINALDVVNATHNEQYSSFLNYVKATRLRGFIWLKPKPDKISCINNNYDFNQEDYKLYDDPQQWIYENAAVECPMMW